VSLIFIFPLIIPGLPILFIAVCTSQITFALLYVLLPAYIWIVVVSSLIYHNAYCKYRITLTGIENKHLSIKWQDIETYKIIRVRLFERTVIPRPLELSSIICFGVVEKDNFWLINSKQCVFFSLTKKNLDKIKEYGKDKNLVVSEIIEKYYNVVY
jgi:hypothetical protein